MNPKKKNERNAEKLSKGGGIENTKLFFQLSLFLIRNFTLFSSCDRGNRSSKAGGGGGGGTLLSSISAAPKGMGREKFLARERYRF